MTEQEAQTDWHQDFTGTSGFLLFVEGKEGIFHRRANREIQQHFDEWRASAWKRFVKMKIVFFDFFLYGYCDFFLIGRL